MIGQVAVRGRAGRAIRAGVHIPADGESRWIYIEVEAEPEVWFAFWGAELTLLEELDQLDGARIHVKMSGESYEDDTLGTDTIGMTEVSDLNYIRVGDECLGYDDVLIDFKRVTGREYHCVVKLLHRDQLDQSGSVDEELGTTCTAEFTATIDEKCPC